MQKLMDGDVETTLQEGDVMCYTRGAIEIYRGNRILALVDSSGYHTIRSVVSLVTPNEDILTIVQLVAAAAGLGIQQIEKMKYEVIAKA